MFQSLQLKSRLRITTLSIKDSTGLVKAKWFGPQYIESRFKEGEDVALSGKPEIKKTGSIEFKNPTIEKFADIDELSETGSLIPIYPKVDGVSSGVIRKSNKRTHCQLLTHLKKSLNLELKICLLVKL